MMPHLHQSSLTRITVALRENYHNPVILGNLDRTKQSLPETVAVRRLSYDEFPNLLLQFVNPFPE